MATIKRFIYYIWYGVKIEKGYTYQMIKHSDLDMLERHHKLMISLGWEKCSDIKAGFKYAKIWYREKN